MKSCFGILRVEAAKIAACASLTAFLAICAVAQRPETRILAQVDNAVRTTLQNSHMPLANAANDAGRMSPSTQLQSMSIYLSRSASQQAALETLLDAQQNPNSPQYHQWLSPDQFAAQYGASDADISAVEGWLAGQGFTVGGVQRNRSVINFTGNVAQIETAFGTEMHYYNVQNEKHFAPNSDLSIPAALAPAVEGVGNLSDFRPKSNVVKRAPVQANFTSSQSGSHFLTPKDVATIYDVNAAYNSGWTGAGISITAVGQSAIYPSDITNFQTAAGVPVRTPALYLVTGSGVSTFYTGDESESDIDLEYSSGIAKGASINFVYTGNNPNYGIFDSIVYAVTNKVGQIISISYGSCEAVFSSYFTYYDPFLQQAAAQGQSVIASSGDNGSDACYEYNGSYPIYMQTSTVTLTTAQQSALSVSWPGSSAYATSLGGSEFPVADVAAGNTTYWLASTGTDALSSATQYIPEVAWNDNSTSSGLSAGGGGISAESLHPSWQTGLSSIPSSAYRLVPDISLQSSPNNTGYLYCSSDSTVGVTGSCSYGFRDAGNEYLTLAGGTSFAAPIFAGMLALIDQSKGATTGMGLASPTLYTLAANATTYTSAFHDITSGNNGCTLGASYPFESGSGSTVIGPACPSTSAGSYSATTGYDLATGLGSVDLNNLLTAWPGTTASAPKSFTISAPAIAITDGNTGTETITITPVNGYTGTVNLTIATTPYISGACYTITSAAISGTAAVTATATIYTNTANCPSGALALTRAGGTQAAAKAPAMPGQRGSNELPAGIALAGLLALGYMGRRSRRLRGLTVVALLALVAGFGLSGCGSGAQAGTGIASGGGGTTTTTATAAKGTYTMSVTGADSTSGVNASTSFTLTVQ
jgi:subtilase family serine protease